MGSRTGFSGSNLTFQYHSSDYGHLLIFIFAQQRKNGNLVSELHVPQTHCLTILNLKWQEKKQMKT